MTKQYIVIGLGSFGAALATRLAEQGGRVTGVDQDKQLVEELKSVLYEAVIADATDREAYEHLYVAHSDVVFISLGEDISPSLLAALHAKESGAKKIVAKGVNDDHIELLKRIGVDEIIFPERDMAIQLANRTIRPNLLNYLPIGDEYTFVEVEVPKSFIGQSLKDVNLRQNYGVWVIGTKSADKEGTSLPEPDYVFHDDDTLLVVGKEKAIERLQAIE